VHATRPEAFLAALLPFLTLWPIGDRSPIVLRDGAGRGSVVAGGREQVVEPVGLLRAQLEVVCGDVLLEARDALGERRVEGPDVLTGLSVPGPVQAPDIPMSRICRGVALSGRPQRGSVVDQLGCWTWPARNLTLSAGPGDDTARAGAKPR